MTRSVSPLERRITATALVLLLFAAGAAHAVVPLVKPPAWRSVDVDYSTGGALMDLNGDGYLDLVTGNGNDMARQPIRVYFNLGGTLDTLAAWSSDDIGWYCHIDLGDYDGDGDLDLAVAELGDPGTPQRDRIYRNEGTTFTTLPVWECGDVDNSFDLAWGDFDGDGDLDLATACGESYTSVPQKSKVYRNDDGVITANSVWRTGPVDYTLDVAWGDVDNDGDLDLACANEFGPNRIYRNTGNGLDSIPFWESADTRNSLQIDFGDVNGDGWLDLAVANNGQLGGVSNAGVYFNTGGGTLATTVGWSSAESRTYFSAVTLADCDFDGDLDLASGGWWEPVVVYENLGGALETTASFSYKFANPAKSIVVESLVWGDLDNSGSTTVFGEAKDGDGVAKVFYLDHAPARSIDEIRVGGVPVAYGDFAYDLDKGWIALASEPPAGAGNVEVDYVFSARLDLVVTNWDPDDANLGFLNEVVTGVVAGAPAPLHFLLPNRPNPFNPSTVIPVRLGAPARLNVSVYDVAGRRVRTLFQGATGAGALDLVWDGTDESSRPVASGVYFTRVDIGGSTETGRMVLIR